MKVSITYPQGQRKSQEQMLKYQSDDVSYTSLQNSQVETLKRKVALFLQYRSDKQLNTPSPSHPSSTTRDCVFSSSFPDIIKDFAFFV